ncbi:MAG: hypothetical protein IJ349_04725 [Clostridia bacterium]|nr:hypothetical protein [Clostridia bacterium]
MINFFDLPEYLQYTLIFFNLILLVINIYCVVSCVIFEFKKHHIVANTVLTAFTCVLYLTAVSANFNYRKNHRTDGFDIMLMGEQFILMVVLLIILAVISAFALYAVLKWKREHITPASIKEGLDRLPAGLCYHNKDGVPKLINHRMDNLCRFITGEPLFDANEFWRKLKKGEVLPDNIAQQTGDNPIVTVLGNTTLSFTKIEREIGGEKLFEIRATDITKKFALSNRLRRSNNELRELNRRLQEYGENVYDITREREILTAKVNIHDMLGKAQLATKRYIENSDSHITKQELIDIWNGTLYLFDGGFAENKDDVNLDELYDAAKIMGIRLIIDGTVPKYKSLLRFVMSGARESLTNAVHHAKARELKVKLYSTYTHFIIEYTNDGVQPEGEISEGGGLSSLRQSVEAAGGIMETDIYPRFILRLKIPAKEELYV